MIAKNIALKPFNTLNIEASSRYFIEISDLADISEALSFCAQQGLPFWVVGGGSNIVITEELNGLVMHMALKGIHQFEEGGNNLVVAAAGEEWDGFVGYCLKQGLYGLENLSLIPGSVGAAPIQNIGAYGVEVSDLIQWVEVWDIDTQSIRQLSNKDCTFGYRDSIFKRALKGKVIITRVAFSLSSQFNANLSYGALAKAFESAKEELSPLDVRNMVCSIRRSKLPDPAKIPNVGSFFKNPVVDNRTLQRLQISYPEMPLFRLSNGTIKIPAGWLIETAGWKGRRIGRVGVHDKQSLVLVNHGEGSGAEVLDIASQIQSSVSSLFNIALEIEPRLLP